VRNEHKANRFCSNKSSSTYFLYTEKCFVYELRLKWHKSSDTEGQKLCSRLITLVAGVNNFKNILQPDAELAVLVVAGRDREEISNFENVLVLSIVRDVDWSCEERKTKGMKRLPNISFRRDLIQL
jgi:hypothetical protein